MKSLILPLIFFLGSLYGVYYTLEQTRILKMVNEVRKETDDENAQTTALAEQRERERDLAKEALQETVRVRTEAQDRLANLRGQETTLRASIKQKEASLAKFKAQQKKFEDTKAEVAKVAAELGKTFTIDNIEQELAAMKATKANRVERVDELDLLIAAAEKSIEENTAELARQVAREEARQLKINRGAIEAVVTGVQQDWGFLVIGAGSNQGFTPTSTLLVKRDGRLIGKVRPSSIEANQTICEIIFPSLARGVRLQPGDKVIFDNPAID